MLDGSAPFGPLPSSRERSALLITSAVRPAWLSEGGGLLLPSWCVTMLIDLPRDCCRQNTSRTTPALPSGCFAFLGQTLSSTTWLIFALTLPVSWCATHAESPHDDVRVSPPDGGLFFRTRTALGDRKSTRLNSSHV